MVAAATTVAFGMNAQDASIETQAIGLVIDAHAFVLKSCYWVVFTDAVLIEINTSQKLIIIQKLQQHMFCYLLDYNVFTII